MAKTIFVLLDGCGDALARESMGYLEHLAETGLMQRHVLQGQLPALSRPLYETLLTGLPVAVHGVTNNLMCRTSGKENIFSLCRAAGLSTAAAAYHWMSEMYNTAPFEPVCHRIQLDAAGAIQNGIFYFEDCYPDSHVLCDGEYLRRTFDPEFLMIHTMNIDDAGHRYGGGSREQALAAMTADTALASLLPGWVSEGWQVLITADHGMDVHGLHGGDVEAVRTLPMYMHSTRLALEESNIHQSQLLVAPLLCRLLGIRPPKGMVDIPLKEVD